MEKAKQQHVIPIAMENFRGEGFALQIRIGQRSSCKLYRKAAGVIIVLSIPSLPIIFQPGLVFFVVKTIINHPFGNSLYHLFMVILGMVYYCFTNTTCFFMITMGILHMTKADDQNHRNRTPQAAYDYDYVPQSLFKPSFSVLVKCKSGEGQGRESPEFDQLFRETKSVSPWSQ